MMCLDWRIILVVLGLRYIFVRSMFVETGLGCTNDTVQRKNLGDNTFCSGSVSPVHLHMAKLWGVLALLAARTVTTHFSPVLSGSMDGDLQLPYLPFSLIAGLIIIGPF